MAGFASGFVSGGLIGAAGLVALSLAMPPRAGVTDAPRAVQATAPITLDRRGEGLVLPDPAAARSRPEAALQTDRPALIVPVPGATQPSGPDQALANVPAGSEFSRATREGAPQIPAPLPAPDLGDVPAEPPAFAAPTTEAAPGAALAQPGTRPEPSLAEPVSLAVPGAGGDQPVAPTADSPVPVPPPGEVVAPQLARPEGAAPAMRLPEAPPLAIRKAP